MKKIIKKPYTKLMLIVLTICLMTMSLTGCGMQGPGHGDGDFSAGGAITGNKVVTAWKHSLSSCNISGAPYEVGNFALSWSQSLDATVDYGLEKENMMSLVRNVAAAMYRSIFGEEWSTTDHFQGTNPIKGFSAEPVHVVQTTLETMKTSSFSSGLSNVFNAVKSIAVSIFVVVWLMGYIALVINERFTFESALKGLLQFLCGVIIINNADLFVNAFIGAGDAVCDKVSAGGTVMFSGFKTEIYEMMKDVKSLNFGISIGFINVGIGTVWIDWGPCVAILYLIFPFIAELLCAYKIISILLMRTLELQMRITFAPIPIAFTAQNGFSQDMLRYIRSTLACALQPAFIVAGAACLPAIADVICKVLGGAGAGAVQGLMASIALTITYFTFSAFVGESKQLAQEVIAR